MLYLQYYDFVVMLFLVSLAFPKSFSYYLEFPLEDLQSYQWLHRLFHYLNYDPIFQDFHHYHFLDFFFDISDRISRFCLNGVLQQNRSINMVIWKWRMIGKTTDALSVMRVTSGDPAVHWFKGELNVIIYFSSLNVRNYRVRALARDLVKFRIFLYLFITPVPTISLCLFST